MYTCKKILLLLEMLFTYITCYPVWNHLTDRQLSSSWLSYGNAIFLWWGAKNLSVNFVMPGPVTGHLCAIILWWRVQILSASLISFRMAGRITTCHIAIILWWGVIKSSFNCSAYGIMVWIIGRVSMDYWIFLDNWSFSEVYVVDSPASYMCWLFH